MPMPAAEIERLIKTALPDAVVELTPFGARLGTELHALVLTTVTP